MGSADSASTSRIVAHLKHLGVALLAIDFDFTLVSEHTGGRWIDSSEELSKYVRTFFRKLIPIALEEGLLVAIVTFSPQVSLIKEVIIHTFGSKLAALIPVRGCDGSWDHRGTPLLYKNSNIGCFNEWGFLGSSRDGKQKHIASVIEHFALQNRDIHIEKENILLIDDDNDNVAVARRSNLRAVTCEPENPRQMERDLSSLL